MTFATVMVSLAPDQPNDARLQVAGDLAARFDAGVIGVAAAEFPPPLYFTTGEQAQDLIERGEAALQNRLVKIREYYSSGTQNSYNRDWKGQFFAVLGFVHRFVEEE